MADTTALDNILRLVAEGRLTAEEAGPILDALDRPSGPSRTGTADATAGGDEDAPARALRVEVTEAGRTVINLRIPLSLGRTAITRVPGISEAMSDRIREAIEGGIRGPIVDVDDEGDGVRISIE